MNDGAYTNREMLTLTLFMRELKFIKILCMFKVMLNCKDRDFVFEVSVDHFFSVNNIYLYMVHILYINI